MKKAFLIAILGMAALTSVAHSYDYNPNLDELRRYSDMRRFADMLKQASFIPVVQARVDCGGWHQPIITPHDGLRQYRDEWQADLNRLPRQQQIHPDGMGGYYWYN